MQVYFTTITKSQWQLNPDARAIIDAVNRRVGDSGDSSCEDRVQAELDACASHDTQKLYGIAVVSEEVVVEG